MSTLNAPGAIPLPDNAQYTNRMEVRSETSDRKYVIAQSKSGRWWSCSCPAWRTRKKCKHLDACGLPGGYEKYEVPDARPVAAAPAPPPAPRATPSGRSKADELARAYKSGVIDAAEAVQALKDACPGQYDGRGEAEQALGLPAPRKGKKGFMDGYEKYDPNVEPAGSPSGWKDGFKKRMGLDEAKKLLGLGDSYTLDDARAAHARTGGVKAGVAALAAAFGKAVADFDPASGDVEAQANRVAGLRLQTECYITFLRQQLEELTRQLGLGEAELIRRVNGEADPAFAPALADARYDEALAVLAEHAAR